MYANHLAYYQWLHLWVRLFPLELTEEELHRALRPPWWLARKGIGRLVKDIHAGTPSKLALEVVGRRFELNRHQARRLLQCGRRLFPHLFTLIYQSSLSWWFLREARQIGVRARFRAAAAQRLADRLPAVQQLWRKRTLAHFPEASPRVRQAPGDPFDEDTAIHARRYSTALHYAEQCLACRHTVR